MNTQKVDFLGCWEVGEDVKNPADVMKLLLRQGVQKNVFVGGAELSCRSGVLLLVNPKQQKTVWRYEVTNIRSPMAFVSNKPVSSSRFSRVVVFSVLGEGHLSQNTIMVALQCLSENPNELVDQLSDLSGKGLLTNEEEIKFDSGSIEIEAENMTVTDPPKIPQSNFEKEDIIMMDGLKFHNKIISPEIREKVKDLELSMLAKSLENKEIGKYGYATDNELNSTSLPTNISSSEPGKEMMRVESFHEDDEVNMELKPVTVTDLRDDSMLTDYLFKHAQKSQICTKTRCRGAQMENSGEPAKKPLTEKQIKSQIFDFFRQYYSTAEMANHEKPDKTMEERVSEVMRQHVDDTIHYLTSDELEWGARTAWRNASRCPARVVWKKLHVFDRRHVETAKEMANCILEHIEYSINGGNIRPAITVFRQRLAKKHDLRVWNGLVMGYACYQQEDGTLVGDPANLELTEFLQKQGWEGKGGRFDFLPIVVNGSDGIVHWFEIPEKLHFTVDIKSSTYPAINDMELQWLGLPGVSSMMFEACGIQFTAAPFAGWYQGTEVASRDFLDPQRYNLLEPIGKAMDLDMSSNYNMWKDAVALELNKAVLESYMAQGVSIVDQYTQADHFVEHMREESKVRGGCPADWVWIVPPQSGSLVSTFHQEMINYQLSPSYEYQDKPMRRYGKAKPKLTFKALSWVMLLGKVLHKQMSSQRKKLTVVNGTETGSSKRFSDLAIKIFSVRFTCSLVPFNTENLYEKIEDADLVLFITSTFGNGEPPSMAIDFNDNLESLLKQKEYLSSGDITTKNKWLKGLNYGVFGLGSTAYPKFAAFGETIDSGLKQLGAKPLVSLGKGDELQDQKRSFNSWIQHAFLASLELFSMMTANSDMMEALTISNQDTLDYQYNWAIRDNHMKRTLVDALTIQNNNQVQVLNMKSRKALHNETDNPSTYLIKFDSASAKGEYQPGGHLGISPFNSDQHVNFIKKRLTKNPPDNQPLQLIYMDPKYDVWIDLEDFPKYRTYDQILRHIVDLDWVPNQELLKVLAHFATDDKEKKTLTTLVDDWESYKKWKTEEVLGICETLEKFPSVQMTAASLISRLKVIKPRLYSIASSPLPNDGSLALVVGIVEYKTPDGQPRKGLTTGSLEKCPIGTEFMAFLRDEVNFRLPEDSSKPVIMIAAGSGIAPFRGFWMKRHEQVKMGKQVGKNILYFGCRNISMDLLKDETEAISKNGLELERNSVYSRENDKPKQYVQNVVALDGAKIYSLWKESGGFLYVCGKIEMAKSVEEALTDMLQKHGNIDNKKALQEITDLRRAKRYQEDIFTT